MPPALLTLLLRLCDNKKMGASAFVIIAALSLWAAGSVYTTLSAQPMLHATTDKRLTAIELVNVDVCAQLKDMSKSLERIDRNTESTRREVSDLQRSLIRR